MGWKAAQSGLSAQAKGRLVFPVLGEARTQDLLVYAIPLVIAAVLVAALIWLIAT